MEIGQGVPLVNIASQISSFWHISEIAATLMPNSFKVFASFRLLHSESCVYSPAEAPISASCIPPLRLFKQESFPLDIRLGATAEYTGMPELPAPL